MRSGIFRWSFRRTLRVLQENVVEPLGARNPVQVNIRVLSATHQNVEEAIRAGRFRQDLYFRLAGAALKIDSLRNRCEDIPVLSQVLGPNRDPQEAFR